ncbi:MAG: amidohydrolase family protein [Dehalococcoidia bacterium]
MIVDAHAHYHPRPLSAALAGIEGGGRGGGFPGAPDTDDADHIERRVEMMDEAGVDLQVLSPAAGRAPYSRNETAAIEAAHIANDLSADLMARYPGRFNAFVSLPLPHIDASLRELERGMDELGMIGLNLHASVLDRSAAEDEFLPIFEEMERRRGVIFYHPAASALQSPLIRDYGFTGVVGTTLEDAMIVLHLIAKQVPARFPNITHVIPHLGGPIPMLLERVDNQFTMEAQGLPEPPSVTAKRFYYDTVCHGSHAALGAAHAAFGAEHMLSGSEYPVLLELESYGRSLTWPRDVLPAEDATQIIERTAPAILGLAGD